MNWTRLLPVTPGWYWYRAAEPDDSLAPIARPVVLEVQVGGRTGAQAQVYGMDYMDPLTADRFKGEWAGPLEAPR